MTELDDVKTCGRCGHEFAGYRTCPKCCRHEEASIFHEVDQDGGYYMVLNCRACDALLSDRMSRDEIEDNYRAVRITK